MLREWIKGIWGKTVVLRQHLSEQRETRSQFPRWGVPHSSVHGVNDYSSRWAQPPSYAQDPADSLKCWSSSTMLLPCILFTQQDRGANWLQVHLYWRQKPWNASNNHAPLMLSQDILQTSPLTRMQISITPLGNDADKICKAALALWRTLDSDL